MTAPRFCFACGAPLPAGARFCPQCAQAIATDPAPTRRDRSHEAIARSTGERRQVAVMFVDLAGFTTLTSTLDAEEVHRLLGRYFSAVDGIVKTYGGSIDKHIGDAVMAVFGAPVAHDNDAERAVLAACEVHEAVGALAVETGHALAAHIGVASGEVVAAGTGSADHSEYTVTGDAVNLASRLEGLAKSGETVVSGSVWRAVSHRFAAESRGTVAVKGLAAPVEVWRVLHGIEAAEVETPFAGRRNELATLAAALQAIQEGGAGRMLVLRGDAGIGKSRLAAECRRRAQRSGIACHSALILDFGVARGRGAIASIVAQLLGCGSATDEAHRTTALEQALAVGDVQRADEMFLRDLLEVAQASELKAAYEAMDAGARARGRLAALRALAEAAALRQPRLIIVEDAHWADALTLDGIAALARSCAKSKALLLVTTRTTDDPFDARWRAQAGPLPLSTMDLTPLSPDEALEVANALATSTADVVVRCVERADGNPLFLIQLMRNASESAAVPASIQSLVLSRIDRLEAKHRAAIQAASVIGQRFPLAALRHVAELPDYGCEVLVDHHLVRPEADEYLFAHALICDGAYASLLNSRKRELHARAAHWYAQRDAGLRARHLDRAGDPSAARAYLDAARELEEGLRFEEAGALAERATALAPDAAIKYEATMQLGKLLSEAGRTPAAIAAFSEAVALAPDSATRCRALIGVALGRRVAGEPDQALAALEEAGRIAEAEGLLKERAVIYHTRGNLHFARGEASACLAAHEASLAAAREAGDLDAEASAFSGLGDASYAQGRLRTAFEQFTACVALAKERGLLRVEAPNLCMRGHCAGFLNQFKTALADTEAGLALSRRLRQPYLEMFGLQSVAMIHLHRGEIDLATAPTRASLELARSVGSRRFEAILLWMDAKCVLAHDDRRLARAQIEAAQAITHATSTEGFLAPMLYGTLALVSDERNEVARLLDEGESWLARGSVGHCQLYFGRDAIDAALAIDDAARVLRYCDQLELYTRAEPLPWATFHIARGRASVAWRRERSAAAGDALRTLRAEAERCALGSAIPAIDAELTR